MSALSAKMKSRRLYLPSVVAFMITLSLCFSLVCVMIFYRSRVEGLTMEQMIIEKSGRINDVVLRLLYKTQMLSSIVLQNDGEIKDFERIASTIIDDPAILNILAAPNGIVTNVYPLEGNEQVLGMNFFSEGAGNKEAALAKETGTLVLGGPFDAVQGGQILVGRLPVYFDDSEGNKVFWGLVSVTLKYPQALDGAGLGDLKAQGYKYEIWRINPDTNEKQIVSGGGHDYSAGDKYVERQIDIANAVWYFRILPVKMWYDFPETWISGVIGLCISLLVAAVTQNNRNLRIMRDKMETMSNEDPLTGIYNRRFFMETAAVWLDKADMTDAGSYIIMFDLDYFKETNDTYGHQAGDKVLAEVSAYVSNILRQNDLFARYGGEEFIILADNIDKNSVIGLAERVRVGITGVQIKTGDTRINATASFGVAPAAPKNELKQAIKLADAALYRAKSEGRNKVIFHDGVEYTYPSQ